MKLTSGFALEQPSEESLRHAMARGIVVAIEDAEPAQPTGEQRGQIAQEPVVPDAE